MSDNTHGSQPRKIRRSKNAAGMFGRRAVGSVNMDDEDDDDGTDMKMLIVLRLARSYETTNE